MATKTRVRRASRKLFVRAREVHIAPEIAKEVIDWCGENKVKKDLLPTDIADRQFKLVVSAKTAREMLETFGEPHLTVINKDNKPKKKIRRVYTNSENGKNLFNWLKEHKVKYEMSPSDRPNSTYLFVMSAKAASKVQALEDIKVKIEAAK